MKHWLLPVAVLSILTLPLSAADNGYIKLRGRPGAAGLFVDGKYVGPASRFTVPEKYPLDPGSHEVSLQDPRYEEFKQKVDVKAGKTTKLHYSMKKLPVPQAPFGRLRLGGGEPESFMSVAAGDVGAFYLNDKFYGYVDELNNVGGGLLIPPGTYQLHVSSPLFGEIRQEVKIEANKVTVVPLTQKEKR
jgi:hypothetical protein